MLSFFLASYFFSRLFSSFLPREDPKEILPTSSLIEGTKGISLLLRSKSEPKGDEKRREKTRKDKKRNKKQARKKARKKAEKRREEKRREEKRREEKRREFSLGERGSPFGRRERTKQ